MLIEQGFSEDCAFEDITTLACVEESRFAAGEFVLKQDAVLAGLPFLARIFHRRDPRTKTEVWARDGQFYLQGTVLGRVEGPAHALLAAEHTALNLLQHLSGIATQTARCVAEAKGTICQIFDTRKTLPGYRALQKYAVRMGGGLNHRQHLADQILIKNNHLSLMPAGNVAAAIGRARECFPGKRIAVEVSSLAQLHEALKAGAHAILLEKMTPGEVRFCVEACGKRAFLEVSGDISMGQIAEYAQTGVDALSIGTLTHSAPAIDIALRIQTM